MNFGKIFEGINVSLELKDLILRMICSDPIKRYSLNDIMNHYWMRIPLSSYEEIVFRFKKRLQNIPPRSLD